MFKSYPKLIVSICLVVAIVVSFWPLKNCDFINFDDDKYVTANSHVVSGITLDGIIWSFTSYHEANWHPLTWISHMADCQLYGLNPRGHHLSNLALHICNALLLFLLLTRVTGALWPSAMVAALFALHPLHVESVAWVAERKDVLSTFFWMTTMWAYVWYVEGPDLKKYLLVLLSYALGLMAKPMLVTLPFVLLLLDWWPLGRLLPMPGPGTSSPATGLAPAAPKTLAGLGVEKIPLLALAAFSCVITIAAQKQALVPLTRIPFLFRLTNAIFSYVSYLGKAIWPARLSVYYPHPISRFSGWELALAGLVLLGCSTLALIQARKRPYLTVGWFWYLGTLVPVIGLVQVGSQAMADRYTYIPLIGIFIMAVWVVRDLTARLPRQKLVLVASAGIVLSICGLLSYQQARYWRSSFSLFKHAIKVTENNGLAYVKLGGAYALQGQIEKAIPLYQKAITLNPNYSEGYNALGFAYIEQGKYDEAIPLCQKAIKIDNNSAEAHSNLGIAYANLGKLNEALPLFQQAIKIKPDFAEAYNNLGLTYAKLVKFDEAIPVFQQAIKINPKLIEPYNNLAMVFADQGKTDEAISMLHKAILINPNNTITLELLNNLTGTRPGSK